MSVPPVDVRRVLAGEWAELRELRLHALASDPLAFGSTLEEERRLDEARWRDRAERGASSESSAQWVAQTADGARVGTIVAALVEDQLHLFSMWVAPEHRGRGVGARLLGAAIDWTTASFPGRSVLLDVNPRQDAARALYERFGFRRTGRERPLGHTAGEVVEEMVRGGA